MALDQPEYFVARLTLDLAAGVRQGEMVVILPKPQAHQSNQEEAQDNQPTAAGISDVVMGLPAELNMVLCKLSLDLAKMKQLSVGEVLKLPHNAFPETDITTTAGVVIGSGTLGQVDGMRALRLKREPVHASQPRRRASDLAELDLPEITALPGTKGGEVQEEFVVNSGVEMIDSTSLSKRATDKPALETLPELDDFPDLADMPQLAQMQ